MDNYTYSEHWMKRGNGFTVEVKKWDTKVPRDRYVWNVYVYIYAKHALFNKLKEESLESGSLIPFDGGCTYSLWNIKADGEVISKKYGNDFAHYYNDYEMNASNIEDVISVTNNANEIFDYLEKLMEVDNG